MLKRDFIMAQIEELAKKILQLIKLRTTDNPSEQAALISEIYGSLKINRDSLLQNDSESICSMLDEGGHSGLQRMEVAAKVLVEESYINPKEKEIVLKKAKQMLEYIQQHDTTFSMERVDVLNEIQRLLASIK